MLESDDEHLSNLPVARAGNPQCPVRFGDRDRFIPAGHLKRPAVSSNLRRIQTCGCLDVDEQSVQSSANSSSDAISGSEYENPLMGSIFSRNSKVKLVEGCRADKASCGPAMWRTVSNLYPAVGCFEQRQDASDHRVPIYSPENADGPSGLHDRNAYFRSSVPAIRAALERSHRTEGLCSRTNEETNLGGEDEAMDKENMSLAKLRPVYLIHPHHHVFGCAEYDEEESDEFFVSSGAVRASCPNIYEFSGFSDRRCLSALHNCHSCLELKFQRDDGMSEIKSYMTDNYDMRLRHAKSGQFNKNSEVSSNATSYGSLIAAAGTGIYPHNINNLLDSANRMVTGLPPLQVPYYSCSSRDESSELETEYDPLGGGAKRTNPFGTTKALSLIVLNNSGNATRGYRAWPRKLSAMDHRWLSKNKNRGNLAMVAAAAPGVTGQDENKLRWRTSRNSKCTSEHSCLIYPRRLRRNNCFVK